VASTKRIEFSKVALFAPAHVESNFSHCYARFAALVKQLRAHGHTVSLISF
jgi:hypothetical protein